MPFRFPLSEKERDLRERARRLSDEVLAPAAGEWDRTEQYPWPNVEQLAGHGFMGLTVPEEWGGPGGSVLEAVLAVEAVARGCGVSGRIVVDSNFGPTGALIHVAADQLKRKYLSGIVAGDKPAIAITEPEAGSAATEMSTSARIEGEEAVVNGRKCWITGGGVSRINLVFCRFDASTDHTGIGGVIVELGTAGFDVPRRERTLGMRSIPEADLSFEECRVPAGNVVVGPGGFKQLMAAYNGQRLAAAAVALGIATGALELAVDYANSRNQFARPIAGNQGLRWLVADMALEVEAARQMIYRAAKNAGHGLPDVAEAAYCKTFAAEMGIRVASQALQVFGARGYSRDLPLERMLRDVRMFTIGGGTTQMLRNLLADDVLGRDGRELSELYRRTVGDPRQ